MKLKSSVSIGIRALKNFVLAGNLLSLRWLLQPRALASFNAETLFLYKALANSRGLPQKNVFEVLDAPGEIEIRLGALQSQDNWFTGLPSYTQDIASLAMLCQILKPKVVFEIGTAAGYTSLHFALNSPAACRVYTLDLPRAHGTPLRLETTAMDDLQTQMYQETGGYLFENSSVADKVTCLYGDSAAFDFAPYHNQVDLFFIDGAHSYAYVRSDTLNALACCHAGSVIAWHDFGRAGLNGVSRWLREFSQEHTVYSIPGGSLAFMRVT